MSIPENYQWGSARFYEYGTDKLSSWHPPAWFVAREILNVKR